MSFLFYRSGSVGALAGNRQGHPARSRLEPGDGMTSEERGVKVRDAAQLRPGVGLGPG